MGISFYLDGKGFQYKSNSYDQARAPGAREWRKRGEVLKFNCTAKGKKEGSINKIIDSMDKRICAVINGNGERTKY